MKGSHDCSLGEGAYGVVFKCLDKQTNKEVAVKKIRMEIEEEGIPTTALREMTLLRSLDHPNVVCLENVVMELGRLHLVFELVETDLKKFLDSTDELLRPEVVQVSGGRDPFVFLLSPFTLTPIPASATNSHTPLKCSQESRTATALV